MKTRLALSILAFVTLTPLSSRAEGREAVEAEEPRLEVEVEDVMGTATLKATESRSAIQATVHSMQVAGHYRVHEGWEVWGYVPFTLGYLNERGWTTSEAVFGNLALAVDHVREVGKQSRFEFEILGAAPTANGDALAERDSTERHATLNALSAAVRGLEDDELYFSHRASIVPRVDFVHEHGPWTFTFFAKAPFLFRAGGVDPKPEDEAKINAVAIDGVIGAQATCALTGEMESTAPGLAVSAGARVVMDYFFREPIDEPEEHGLPPEQFFTESILMARYGAFRARGGILVPLGGRLLDAHEQVHGFRFSVAWMH